MDEIRDPYDLWMTCSVNGERRMRLNTADQIWKLPDIIEHFSRYLPFEPGDMFATGSPGGPRSESRTPPSSSWCSGDVVECGTEGLMTPRTRIVVRCALMQGICENEWSMKLELRLSKDSGPA